MRKPAYSLSLLLLLAIISCTAKVPHLPRVVDLTASDGITLKTSYFAAGKPGPGVLLLHQCDHDRKIWDGLALQLAKAGINVMTMDLRGFGESGGRPHNSITDPGPIEPAEEMQMWPGDIDVAYQYLKSQPGVKPDVIGVAGGSCGVNNALHTAMRHPEVKSLVLLAGPADLKARAFLRQSKLPMFFVVADDDQYPGVVQETERLYLASASPGKKFSHYQTGHHAAEIFPVHPELPAAIVDWYDTTLIKTPGRAPVAKSVFRIPAEVQILDVLDQPGGPAKISQMLSQARQKDPGASILSLEIPSESGQKDSQPPAISELMMEEMIDDLANEHFDAEDVQQGMEITKLDLVAYPNSPAAYALLSYGNLLQGQTELARQNAKKALKLLASDTAYPEISHDAIKDGIAQILKQLDTPDKK